MVVTPVIIRKNKDLPLKEDKTSAKYEDRFWKNDLDERKMRLPNTER